MERPFGHLGRGKKKWSPRVWGLSAVLKSCVSESKQKRREKMRTRCSLEELREWEQAKEERKKESKRTYTVRKRAVSEKRVFLHSNCISKCCNLYLIYWNYSEFVPWFFPSRRKSYHINFCVFVWCVSVVLAEIYSQLYKIFPNNLVTSGIKVWWLDLGL